MDVRVGLEFFFTSYIAYVRGVRSYTTSNESLLCSAFLRECAENKIPGPHCATNRAAKCEIWLRETHASIPTFFLALTLG